MMMTMEASNRKMTNGELIKTLSKHPSDSKVNFMLFSNLTPRRCDVSDGNLMILRSPHTGDVNIMLNLERYWEEDIVRRNGTDKK